MSLRGSGNPFANRAMIAAADDFFGRRREIDTVLARVLSGSKAQSLSVVGQRRIGKSSLFRRLSEVVKERDPHTVVAYYDLEASRKLSAGRFFAILLGRLARAIGVAVAPPADVDAWEALEAFLEARGPEQRFVLLLDEFDTVTANPAFDADFFGSLRYLANNFDLAFVTSSYEDLTDLCHAEEIRQSPFFNVFTTLDLGLMHEAEIAELVEVLGRRGAVKLEPADRELARELGGRFPFFVQIAASACWELRNAGAAVVRGEVESRFRAEAEGHFRYFVDHLPEAEREALRELGRGGRPAESLRRRLERRSLVDAAPGAGPLFSPRFQDFVARRAGEQRGSPGTPTTRAWADPGSGASGASGKLAAGVVVAARYRLLRPLGQGSYGWVWEAEDEALRRRIALKLLRTASGRADDGERRARFVREARVLARLRHPNVVAVHDMGEWQGEPWIAMELVEGGTLADLLVERGPLGAVETARLARDAALGLGHAHGLGIVHRDVKPANLMLEGDGRLRVGDFGVGIATSPQDALALERVTGEGRTVGTPSYMAPEQLRGGTVDGRADLYALGVVMFECLTGSRPFEGLSVASVIARILTEEAPDPRVRVGTIPEGLARLVLRVLAADPAERYPSGEDLARVLEEFAVPTVPPA